MSGRPEEPTRAGPCGCGQDSLWYAVFQVSLGHLHKTLCEKNKVETNSFSFMVFFSLVCVYVLMSRFYYIALADLVLTMKSRLNSNVRK